MTDYRKRRKQLGLTQEELAEMAGIGTRTLQYIESGAHSPKLEQWFSLQMILCSENDGSYYYVWNPDSLRNIRRERKMTQAELAQKVGVSVTSIKMWENDITPSVPSVDNLNMVCLCLRRPVNLFFVRKEKESYCGPLARTGRTA